MAIALVMATEPETCVMKHTPTIIALAFLALTAVRAAQAQTWTNSAMYNGYGASSQNTASNYSMRDGNGNLTMVNGQVTSSTYAYAWRPVWRRRGWHGGCTADVRTGHGHR